MKFTDLPLIEPLQRALLEEGYSEPTPIQQQAIGPVLEGRDLLGIAQTGTGKTAAFALPVLQRLHTSRPLNPAGTGRRPVRALVLAPTRELAAQVGASFAAYGRHLPLKHAVVYGGVGIRPQAEALWHGVDVLVATPGRLLDLMDQRRADLRAVSILVLDEADRMLDMGFLPAVRRVLAALPRARQTLFFSATMAGEPQALADRILTEPVRVEVSPQATTVEKVEQVVHYVDRAAKQALLEKLLEDPALSRALVFTRTKHGADKVVRRLHAARVNAAAIHANKSQGQRERALEAFRAGRTRVLVATDIAARGIDVDAISHVINYDLPNVPESYVHRIGRTARAGAAGRAISFCDGEERPFLRDIEREIRQKIPVAGGAPRQTAGAFGRAQDEGAPDAAASPAAARPRLPHGRGPRPEQRHEPHRPQHGPTHPRRPDAQHGPRFPGAHARGHAAPRRPAGSTGGAGAAGPERRPAHGGIPSANGRPRRFRRGSGPRRPR